MADCTVVILTWNNFDFIRRFLPVMVDHTPPDQAAIMIADNGSTDASLEWISAHYPQIEILTLGQNYGFTGGYLRALRQVKTSLAVLMNSDIEVRPGWIEPLLEIARSAKVGAVMPKILFQKDPSLFEYAGASGGYIDRYGYPFCRGRLFDRVEKDQGQYDQPANVFWASGACMMLSMKAYREAGELDEGFFAHMEEIDLCWRMQLRGYEIKVNPASEVWHVGGGTLPNEHPHKLFLNFRNSLLMLHKNLAKQERFKTLLIRMLLDGVAAIKYLLAGKWHFFSAVLKAHMAFHRLRKHTKNQHSSLKLTALTGVYPGSVVYQYFIRGKKSFAALKSKRFEQGL